MTYILLVYTKTGEEVFRKVYKNTSGHAMQEIYKDYAHLGGKGGFADYFPYYESDETK